MVAVALSGFLNNDGTSPEGTIVTAVFPGGCQLNCGFCIVRHRDERNTGGIDVPPPDHYFNALRAYAATGQLAGAAVVGDEPLQEPVWPYVEGFLGICTAAGRPSTLITNGLGLLAFTERLQRLDMTEVVVSVDGVGGSHDRIRGMSGAYERIERGLQAISRDSSLFRRLSIATVLRPSHLDDARQVLQLVARLGVSRWFVSALLDPRPGKPVRIHKSLRPQLADMLRSLGSLAADYGVNMIATDEFGLVEEIDEVGREAGFSVKRPRSKPTLVRLDARGRSWTWKQLMAGLVESEYQGPTRDIATRLPTVRLAF